MKKNTIKQILQNELPKKNLDFVKNSFEIIKDIAIVEIENINKKFEKKIGEAVLKINKNINCVYKKFGNYKGRYRLRKLKFILGEKIKETLYFENGTKFLVNPIKVYFSQKLSNEREFLSREIKNKKVLIMFSGLGPYIFVFLKKNPNLDCIFGIEINPKGHKLAKKNLELNKNWIKKNLDFLNTKRYLKKNKVSFFEKDLIFNLNYLKVGLIKGDVSKKMKSFNLKELKKEIKIFDNKIFLKKFKDILKKIKSRKKIFLNLNVDIDFEKIRNFMCLYPKKTYIIKIKNKIYLFKKQISKVLLFSYLKNKKFEKISSFDKIIMPHPSDSFSFLDLAQKYSSKNSKIHQYVFLEKNNLKNFKTDFEKKFSNLKIEDVRKVGLVSSKKNRYCLDLKKINK